MNTKPKPFTTRLGVAERFLLRVIAQKTHRTQGEVIREGIRLQAEQLGLSTINMMGFKGGDNG